MNLPCSTLATEFPAFTPFVPTAEANARANPSISMARIGNRWSAFTPVDEGVLSTTYNRFILPSGLRCLAYSRAYLVKPGKPAYRKSASSETMTSAFSSLY